MDHFKNEALFIVQSIILIGLPFALWKLRIVKSFMPLVVMQIITGIVLGPSVFGRIFPHGFEILFPAQSVALLSSLSWLALILFGFLTGLHFDTKEIKGKGKSFSLVSLTSILVPSILGGLAGWWAFHYNAAAFVGDQATMITFVLGFGIAAGVTALPVLGATLIDMNLIDKPLGRKALGYATVNDGLLWIFVAVLLSLAASHGGTGTGYTTVIRTIVLTIVYFAAMIMVIRPILVKLARKQMWIETPTNGQLVAAMCILFASALATELIGVHYLLGAFTFGAIMPKELAHGFQHKIEPVVAVVLLPFFFMTTGLKTNFDLLSGSVWVLFGIVTVLSSLGKVFGTTLAERFVAKSSWPTAWKLGGFMQCKGLMEVIVLNMLLAAGIITTISFSALILMAVVTTAITKPFVLLIHRMFYGPHVAIHEAPAYE